MESKISKIAVINIEIEEKGHIFRFSLPVGVSLSIAYEASLKCVQVIVDIMNEKIKEQTKKEEGKKVDEEEKIEEPTKK